MYNKQNIKSTTNNEQNNEFGLENSLLRTHANFFRNDLVNFSCSASGLDAVAKLQTIRKIISES